MTALDRAPAGSGQRFSCPYCSIRLTAPDMLTSLRLLALATLSAFSFSLAGAETLQGIPLPLADQFSAGRVQPAIDQGEVPEFNGTWLAWLCPDGLRSSSGKCDNFVLELIQDQDRLCGAHVFATAGAREVDEGTPPSIRGVIENGIAKITLASNGSNPPKSATQLEAELSRVKAHLLWRRLDDAAGSLLPAKTLMIRSSDNMLHPEFEQRLRAACAIVPLPPEAAPPRVRS